ncbi:MAG: undecaprenyl-phosphate glucose phosphotransferase [Erysipelotrichaceae bacterium]|nr:undecaprenyl-phosphate glucose phosphotransferase [Sphaerochaetaceae bacterium]NLV29026.1 undecaprenyl-phosphate glucose phosphotransferase [Erysipelotrichaceae bacterium]
MLNRKASAYSFFVLRIIFDSIVVFVSWMLAYYLRFYVIPGGVGAPLVQFLWLGLLVVIIFLIFLNGNKLYQNSQELPWQAEVQSVIRSAMEGVFSFVFVLYFFFDIRISRMSIAIFSLLVALLLIVERIILKNRYFASWSKNKNIRTVLLVGHGEKMNQYYHEIANGKTRGVKAIGQLNSNGHPIKALQQFQGNLHEVVSLCKPDMVVISYPTQEYEIERKVVSQSLSLLEDVVLIPNLPQSYIGLNITEFHKIPVAYLNDANFSFLQRVSKRLFDFLLSLLITIAISPFLLLLALLVKLSSPGPVIFKQKRITEHGRVFTMLKFRSMNNDPKLATVAWTTKDDPRITKIGKFMRKTSLDELPQLFNIIKGDMSLIGPRPERPELVEKFLEEIPGYQLRHKVKAGLSGWAQVNGLRGDTSLVERIDYDLYYIRNWSFLFDLRIFFFTFITGFINKNAY